MTSGSLAFLCMCCGVVMFVFRIKKICLQGVSALGASCVLMALVGTVVLFTSGCATLSVNPQAEQYRGKYPSNRNRFGRFRSHFVTKAPLRVFYAEKMATSCNGVLPKLVLQPEGWLGAENVRWDHSHSSNGSAKPGPGSLRSYHFEGLRITEKIHTISPRHYFAYSFVASRHSALWPFANHLSVVTAEPDGSSCLVTWRHYYEKPWGLSAVRAEQILSERMVEAGLSRIRTGVPIVVRGEQDREAVQNPGKSSRNH